MLQLHNNSAELLWGLLVALNLADVVSTMKVLKAGGKELNPVMRFFMTKLGNLPGLLAPKAVILTAAYWAFVPSNMWAVLGALCLLYVFVVAHNVKQ